LPAISKKQLIYFTVTSVALCNDFSHSFKKYQIRFASNVLQVLISLFYLRNPPLSYTVFQSKEETDICTSENLVKTKFLA